MLESEGKNNAAANGCTEAIISMDEIDNDPVIIGEIVVRRNIFLSRKIPATIHAKNNGIKFTIYREKYRSRYVPYQDLKAIDPINSFGRQKIIIHAYDGSEIINCHSTESKIGEFCRFVNEKISLLKRKPLAAKFALTKTEVPSEKNYTTWVYDEYGSAIDILFNQEGSTDDLLENLEREIASLTAGKESVANSPRSPVAASKYRRPVEDHPLFQRKHSYPWNIDYSKFRLKNILPASAVIIALLFTAIWVIGRAPMVPDNSGDEPLFAKSKPPDSPSSVDPTTPSQRPRDKSQRAMLHLITLMNDDDQYTRIIDRLRQKRELLNIDSSTLSNQIGWDASKLANIERHLIRATPMDLVNISIHINEDFYDAIEFSK